MKQELITSFPVSKSRGSPLGTSKNDKFLFEDYVLTQFFSLRPQSWKPIIGSRTATPLLSFASFGVTPVPSVMAVPVFRNENRSFRRLRELGDG